MIYDLSKDIYIDYILNLTALQRAEILVNSEFSLIILKKIHFHNIVMKITNIPLVKTFILLLESSNLIFQVYLLIIFYL